MPYTRVRELGRGFFGVVFLENDDALNRLCAAKYLNPGHLAQGREFDEARRMIDSEHEHVVRLYSADMEHQVPVIRMEYLANGSVEAQYAKRPAPVLEATLILEDATRGVEALHARGVLHRDIKPANLLIGDNQRVKVSDFGLACIQGQHHAATTLAYPPHLPPEAIAGSGVIEDTAGDVYALGVTAYRLLNGDDMLSAAIPSGTTDLRPLILAGKFPDTRTMQPYIHHPLRRAVAKALNGVPGRRYGAASDFRHAIEACRPVVSWRPDPLSMQHWLGQGPGGRSYDAVLETRGSAFTFKIRKGSGAGMRAVTTDGFTGGAQQATAHAAQVLQRYAQHGR